MAFFCLKSELNRISYDNGEKNVAKEYAFLQAEAPLHAQQSVLNRSECASGEGTCAIAKITRVTRRQVLMFGLVHDIETE